MTAQEIIREINSLMESASGTFNNNVPGVQQRVLDEINDILRGLTLKYGKIDTSVKNLKIVQGVSGKLRKIIMDEGYKSDVSKYIKAYDELTDLQNQYFAAVETKYKPTPLLKAIKDESVNTALDGLTESGLQSNVISPLSKILKQSVTTGGSLKDLQNMLTTNLTDDQTGDGIMSKYLKTYTTTSISQYSRNYSQTVAGGLNFNWYQYTGSNIETTRCFCLAMTKKKYFHVSEIPDLLAGNFPEFAEQECDIYQKTGLPDGMINGTNPSNFITLAGGWNCQHGIYPIPDAFVPKDLRQKFE